MKTFHLNTGLQRAMMGLVVLLVLQAIGFRAQGQPQYTLNFTTSTSPSAIPFLSNVNNKAQWLFYHTDFPAAPSGNITRIYFRRNSSMLPVVNSYTNLVIKMGQSTLTALPPGPWITSGMTTVFQANTFDFIPVPVDWMPVTLQIPFSFDNTKNFIVEVSHGGYTVGFEVMQGTITARSLYGSAGSLMGNSQNALCDFGFDIGLNGVDATLTGFSGIEDTICSGFKPVAVILKNNGPGSLTSASLNWKVDNNQQPSVAWTGNLGVNASAIVNLGNYNFLPSTIVGLKAWVSIPNNLPDLNVANDTTQINNLTVWQSPTIAPSSPNYSICMGDSTEIIWNMTGIPPWHIIYSDGNSSYTTNQIYPQFSLPVKPAVTTTYLILSIEDGHGCIATNAAQALVAVHPKPIVNLGPDQSIKASHQCTLNAGAGFTSYQWSTGATTQTIVVDGTVAGVGTHSYSVTVTNTYGCLGSDTVLVTVSDDVGLSDHEQAPHIQLSPNPSNGQFVLHLFDFPAAMLSIEMIEPGGKIVAVKTHQVCGPVDHVAIDVGQLPVGLYILHVRHQTGVYTEKLMITQ